MPGRNCGGSTPVSYTHLLAFGCGFLLPVFLAALNAARILPARVMFKAWRMAVFLIFVFAAMMTPTRCV